MSGSCCGWYKGGLARIIGLILCAVIAGGVPALGQPELALAAGVLINFERPPGPPPGTVLTNEYQGQGIIFGENPFGSTARSATIAQVGPTVAHSGTQVAEITHGCTGEVRVTEMWARFTSLRHSVQLYANELSAVTSYPLTLEAWGTGGNSPLATDVETVVGGSWTSLSVNRQQGDIAFIHLDAGQTGVCTAIDDLTFDAPATTTPDFGLAFFQTGIGTSDGHSGSGTIVVNRFGGSSGRIQFSASNLPTGVTAAFSPQPLLGSNLTSNVTLTLSAAVGAPSVTNWPIVVSGQALEASAGDTSITRFVTVPVTVANTYTIIAKSIEVTQGIQSTGLPQRDLNLTGLGTLSAPFLYQGVGLQARRKTVVRVFADLLNVDQIAGVNAELFGFDNLLRPLPGPNPVMPDNQPLVVATNPFSNQVTVGERIDVTGAPFEFTLPDAWVTGEFTQGNITVQAVLTPPGQISFDNPTQEACDAATCLNLREVAVSGIHFSGMTPITIVPIHANVEGNTPAPPHFVFSPAFQVTPGDLIVTDYQGDVEMIDLYTSSDSRSDKSSTALDRIEDWDEDNGYPGQMVVGVTSGIPPGPTPDPDLGMEGPNGDAAYAGRPRAVVDQLRVLTSVAHELNHGLGRVHASFACGAGDVDNNGPAEHWPPDERGDILGVGFDVNSHSVNAPGPNGTPEWFDLMSYCAQAVPGSAPGTVTDAGNTWNSDRGWTEVFNRYDPPGSSSSSAAPASPSRQSVDPSGTIIVAAIVTASGTRITRVKPSTALIASVGSSPFHVRVLDAGGNTISDKPALVQVAHSDPSPFGPGGKAVFVEAQVPAAGAARVQLTFNGTLVAQRVRSPHAPAVVLIAPAHGARLGVGPTTPVQWHATDADHDPLTAKVDYSRDDGQTWRTVFSGPNQDQALISSSFLPRSEHARIRVRVNDGFNETAVVSGPLKAEGSPPSVYIVNPLEGASFRDDASIVVSGRAFDDAFRPLNGDNLGWFVDGRKVGRGQTLTLEPLAPGHHTLKLEARDELGRSASAQAQVTVFAVKPLLLELKHPDSIARCADQVHLTVASTVRGTLSVNGRTFEVSRDPRQVTLTLQPGAAPVQLNLVLSAFGMSSSGSLTIPRNVSPPGEKSCLEDQSDQRRSGHQEDSVDPEGSRQLNVDIGLRER